MSAKNRIKRLLIPFCYINHIIFNKVPYKPPLKFSEYFKISSECTTIPCKKSHKSGCEKVALLPQGRVFGQNGFIISSENYILEPNITFSNIKKKDNPFTQMLSLPEEIYLEGNVATFGDYFVDSYYHWFFDILPRLSCFKNSGVHFDYYIFPKFSASFQRDALTNLGIPLEKVKFLDNKTLYRAEKLYCCGISLHCPDIVQCRLDLHKSLATAKNPSQYQKIYISRQKTNKRKILNEDEIIPVFEKFGYKTIFFEGLTLQEQIDVVHNVRFVVAPHGAGLTNLIFANNIEGVVEIYEKRNTNLCYQVAAKHRRYKHIRIEAKSRRKNIILNPKILEKELALLEDDI